MRRFFKQIVESTASTSLIDEVRSIDSTQSDPTPDILPLGRREKPREQSDELDEDWVITSTRSSSPEGTVMYVPTIINNTAFWENSDRDSMASLDINYESDNSRPSSPLEKITKALAGDPVLALQSPAPVNYQFLCSITNTLHNKMPLPTEVAQKSPSATESPPPSQQDSTDTISPRLGPLRRRSTIHQ